MPGPEKPNNNTVDHCRNKEQPALAKRLAFLVEEKYVQVKICPAGFDEGQEECF
jgi:hypothetical protein